MQKRNGSLLNSVLTSFLKAGKHDETQDPIVQESKRKLEERIESVLGDTISPRLNSWGPVEYSIAAQSCSDTGLTALALSHNNPSRA